MPVERDTALKALHERINKYRNAPQDDSGSNLYWISEGPRPGVGYFYALTPVYLANRLQALLGVEQTIRMENFSYLVRCRWGLPFLMKMVIP